MHLEADSMHLFIKWWSRFFIANDGIIRIHILQSSVQSAISILQPLLLKLIQRSMVAIFRVKVVFSEYIFDKTSIEVKISKFVS
jgi:hypothetical protein